MNAIREELTLHVLHLHSDAEMKTGYDQKEFCYKIADLILTPKTLQAFVAGQKPQKLGNNNGEIRERLAFRVFDLHSDTDMKTGRDQREFCHRIADFILARRHAHLGDPCIYCGTPHDEVAVGDCLGFEID